MKAQDLPTSCGCVDGTLHKDGEMRLVADLSVPWGTGVPLPDGKEPVLSFRWK